MCLLCADVGSTHPVEFASTKRCPQPEATPFATDEPATAGGPPTGEAERVLRQVERNFTSLARTVPMVEIKDPPPSMQPHVVGAHRTWVRLFHHLENTVDHYNRANMPRP
jgi:hypothetical protein